MAYQIKVTAVDENNHQVTVEDGTVTANGASVEAVIAAIEAYRPTAKAKSSLYERFSLTCYSSTDDDIKVWVDDERISGYISRSRAELIASGAQPDRSSELEVALAAALEAGHKLPCLG